MYTPTPAINGQSAIRAVREAFSGSSLSDHFVIIVAFHAWQRAASEVHGGDIQERERERERMGSPILQV